jgi:ABC-2 type transport system permease protein
MQLLALIWKELLVVFRDKRSRIAIILPPVTQLFLFGLAATFDVKNVSLGILNRDSGEKAFELVERFIGSPTFTKITFLKSVEEIQPFIDNQRGLLAISIDDQFSTNVNAKKPASVQVILDGRKYNSAQIVTGYVGTIVNQFNQDIYGTKKTNIEVIPRTWFNPNVLFVWYNIPCLIGTLSMLICLIVTGLSVAREKEIGTFDQLLISPLVPYQIAIGKIVPGVIVGFFEGIFMAIMGKFVFHVPFNGSVLELIATLLVFVSAISGFGLFISSICKTQQQAVMGILLFMVPSVTLSGFSTPIANMPQWLQMVTYIMPIRYALINFKGIILKGIPLSLVLHNLWPMILIAISSVFGATLFFKRKVQ